MFVVESRFKVVSIYSGELNFITRLAAVDKIGEEDNLLLTWQAPSRYGPRRLLDSNALKIAVDCVFAAQHKATTVLAGCAGSWLLNLSKLDNKRAENRQALWALVLCQLRGC